MSQIDQFLNYLSTLNESTIQLTKQDYQKICAIRDKVTELAIKVSQTQPVAQTKVTSVKEKAKAPSYQQISEGILPFNKYFESK